MRIIPAWWGGVLCIAGLWAQPIPRPQPGVGKIDWRGHLSQHDLVYLSPPTQGHEGLPLGDGEAGAILWNSDSGVTLQLNHSALWDDLPVETTSLNSAGFKTPRTDSEKEGEISVQRHAAQLKIETGLPLFDWKYLRNYEARLNLHNAQVELAAEGSMGEAHLTALYSHPRQTLVIEYRDKTRVPVVRRIGLERFGSRTFPRWAGRIVQDPEIGLGGTSSGAEGREFWIRKKFGSVSFAVAGLLAAEAGEFTVRSLNQYQAVAESPPTTEAAFTLYLAIAHSDETGDALRLARDRVRKAAADGIEQVRAAHRADWAKQWDRAFIDLPQDRFVENLWRLIDYTNVASKRGPNAPFFLNSIWAWSQDIQVWAGSYYHWNQWSPNFPLFANGRLELLRGYFEWKKRQLPHAIAYAKAHFGIEGAAFTDYASRRGEQPRGGHRYEKFVAVGPQVAQEFFKYWQYSHDDQFLKQQALPFLRETARFYLNYLEEGQDGKLHIRETLPYEFAGPYHFRDCITDQAMLRWLLPALMEAERAAGMVSDLSRRAADCLRRLAPIRSGPIHEDWLTETEGKPVYANPFFRGERYSPADRVYSIGWSTKHLRDVTHMEVGVDPESVYGVMPGAQVAPVWPAGLIGPDASPERRAATGRDSAEDIRMWEQGRNGLRTLRKFPRQTIEKLRALTADTDLSWTGHNNDLPAFPRLGLTKQLRVALDTYIQKYQLYPQGFWNYWPWLRWKDGVAHPAGTVTKEPFPFPEDPRVLHHSLEPTGIFSVTVDEMLMTSYDGAIRLFPAYERDAGFRLAAAGGFWVTARRAGGAVEFVQVESYAGQGCVISNPWPGTKPVLRILGSGEAMPFSEERDRIRFATRRGEIYLLTPTAVPIPQWQLNGKRRTKPHVYVTKVYSKPYFGTGRGADTMTNRLGKERDF
jgi:hypothetical protein